MEEKMMGKVFVFFLSLLLVFGGIFAYKNAPERIEKKDWDFFKEWGFEFEEAKGEYLEIGKQSYVLSKDFEVKGKNIRIFVPKGSLYVPVTLHEKEVGAVFFGSYRYEIETILGEFEVEGNQYLLLINLEEFDVSGEKTEEIEKVEMAKKVVEDFKKGRIPSVEVRTGFLNVDVSEDMVHVEVGPVKIDVPASEFSSRVFLPRKGFVGFADNAFLVVKDNETVFTGLGFSYVLKNDEEVLTFQGKNIVRSKDSIVVNIGFQNLVFEGKYNLRYEEGKLVIEAKIHNIVQRIEGERNLVLKGENFSLVLTGDYEIEEFGNQIRIEFDDITVVLVIS